jgi:hypothetical protein
MLTQFLAGDSLSGSARKVPEAKTHPDSALDVWKDISRYKSVTRLQNRKPRTSG